MVSQDIGGSLAKNDVIRWRPTFSRAAYRVLVVVGRPERVVQTLATPVFDPPPDRAIDRPLLSRNDPLQSSGMRIY